MKSVITMQSQTQGDFEFDIEIFTDTRETINILIETKIELNANTKIEIENHVKNLFNFEFLN